MDSIQARSDSALQTEVVAPAPAAKAAAPRRSARKAAATSKATRPAASRKTAPGKPVSVRSAPARAVKPKPTVAAPAAAPAKPAKAKAKLVRDSFTMPQADFDLIDTLKDRALGFKRPTKKSELLRAGLHTLLALDAAQLRSVLDALVPLKPGRPKKLG